MKKVNLGKTNIKVPSIIIGCMRFNSLSEKDLSEYIHTAIENGANFFDHADIYGKGVCEELFGKVIKNDSTLKREDIIIQSKCGIRENFYDQSKDYIISSVDNILKRLQTDYIDILLLHRPDALVEPEEVSEAFYNLKNCGKVRYFGVSNHKPMQIELLKKYLKQDLVVNQLQFSLLSSNMVSNGLEVNMQTNGGIDRDNSVLDYCRLNDITIQAWSPFQAPNWSGPFIENELYKNLNDTLDEMAKKYKVTKTAIASSWILRHPANMQIVSGTTKINRLLEVLSSTKIELTREDWYKLYLSTGNILP